MAQAFCIGNKEAQPRDIIVKFVDQAQRNTALANNLILKERRIWLDSILHLYKLKQRGSSLQKSKKLKQHFLSLIYVIIKLLLFRVEDNHQPSNPRG